MYIRRLGPRNNMKREFVDVIGNMLKGSGGIRYDLLIWGPRGIGKCLEGLFCDMTLGGW